jgi:SHS2 domain-containing protein
MFNYMTPLSGIRTAEGDAGARRYAAEGHDLPSLLYHWLDEMLFSFSTDFFVPRSIEITRFDLEECRIEAVG